MKPKSFTQIFKYVVVIILFFNIIQTTKGVDLVSYNLATVYSSTSGIASNHPGGTFSTTASSPTFASNRLESVGWDSGTAGGFKSYSTSSFSTFGYISVLVNASMWTQTTNGAKNFNVQYKIGASGTWTTVTSLTITTVQKNYQVALPTICSNKASVYIRWIATAYATTNSIKNYINAVSILASNPSVPNSQASGISFVSITPTTISVSCTPGNGDNRIIKMNTVNSFTDPVNDENPSANTTYGSGEQVVYNGSGSFVTVTVPSSTNIYYFRVYDYDYNTGVTRYITVTEANNPNECALETIVPNAVTNLRLTSATIGGTISMPVRNFISDRGIVWSTSPNVQESDNPSSEGGTTGGSFSLNFPDLANGFPEIPRGSTIYYKAYVTNISGTIYSAEASFTNVPTFTGTGTWETAARWNVQEVPGTNGSVNGSIDDSPIINGTCTMGSSHGCTDLTINSGKSLTIQPAVSLNVQGVLTNSAGTSGLKIKASSSQANGSLIFASPGSNSNVPASVEMYSIANMANQQYHWQYFGIPVQSQTIGTTFKNIGAGTQRIRKYDEANHDATGQAIGLWKPSGTGNSMISTDAMIPVDGYEVVQPSATTYTFAGNLYTNAISKSLSYTPTSDWPGNHVIANPYTASINIASITSGNFGSLEQAVYLYNTGSREEWTGGTSTGNTPGTYIVSTPGTAGVLGVPAEIPSMQGFLVRGNSSTSINIPYSTLVTSTSKQRAKALSSNIAGTRIDVIGSSSSDRAWIFSSSDFTNKFDNGYDGRKFMTSGATQLYAIEEDGEYQIAATNDMNNVQLGFTPATNGEYKLIFTNQNIQSTYGKIYLIDMISNTTIDATNNAEYTFTATPTDPAQRFRIVTSTTKTTEPVVNMKMFNTEKNLIVQNDSPENGYFVLYNADGRIISTTKISAFTKNVITNSNMQSGVYIGKLTTDTQSLTQRLIIR